MTFKKTGAVPYPVKILLSHKEVWVYACLEDQVWEISFGTPRGVWKFPDSSPSRLDADFDPMLPPFFFIVYQRTRGPVGDQENEAELIALRGSESPTDKDWKLIHQLVDTHRRDFGYYAERPFASAPVRSEPRRTYDPSRPVSLPEGYYVPMYLASMFFQNKQAWTTLKKRLEEFGKAAGLFDEISIKSLGKRESEPFQVQIRKFSGQLKGPPRNLIDVGYGVSQVLPVITELLRPDERSMFLLQQPEVHLHPSAQAALGSLFCQLATPERQLVIETHSDHLLDRVRMDVRDGTTPLKPEDVSILFFERKDLDVRIHSLRIDEEGNIKGAPDGYRNFFLEETARSLWKREATGT